MFRFLPDRWVTGAYPEVDRAMEMGEANLAPSGLKPVLPHSIMQNPHRPVVDSQSLRQYSDMFSGWHVLFKTSTPSSA